MKSKQEMKEAMDQGKVLIKKDGAIAYLNFEAGTESPYVWVSPKGSRQSLSFAWDDYIDFEVFEVLEEPKQITDRWKLKAKVWRMIKEGNNFYIRYNKCGWFLPLHFGIDSTTNKYEWTEFDSETGQPIGEPQKFMED